MSSFFYFPKLETRKRKTERNKKCKKERTLERNVQMDGRTNKRKDERTDGRMDKRTGRQTDRQRDRQIDRWQTTWEYPYKILGFPKFRPKQIFEKKLFSLNLGSKLNSSWTRSRKPEQENYEAYKVVHNNQPKSHFYQTVTFLGPMGGQRGSQLLEIHLL